MLLDAPNPNVPPDGVAFAAIEAPLIATTSLSSDQVKGGSRTRQKRNGELRRRLQLPEPTLHSLGRRGKFSVDFLPFFFAVLADARWRETNSVELLCSKIVSEGISSLVQNPIYHYTVERVVSIVKEEAPNKSRGISNARLVNSVIRRLLSEDVDVRAFANQTSKALKHVAELIPQVERLIGQVVREEGPNTLIVVHEKDRDVLRLVETTHLKRFGIGGAREPIVIYRQQWTAETSVSQYLPAISVSNLDAREELDQQLRDLEVPFPNQALTPPQ